MVLDSVMSFIQNKLEPQKDTFLHISVFEVVLIVMTEVEKATYLSGVEKEEYCVELMINYCNVNADLVKIIIRNVIDISKGKSAINQSTKRFGCFGK